MLLKCGDFLALYRPIASGELRRESDDRNGEELIAPTKQSSDPRRAAERQLKMESRNRPLVEGVAKDRTYRCADWATHSEPGHAPDDLAPVAHRAQPRITPATRLIGQSSRTV